MLLQVIDIPNSMTVLPELLPYSIEMVSASVSLCSVVFLGVIQLTWLCSVVFLGVIQLTWLQFGLMSQSVLQQTYDAAMTCLA